MPSDLEAMDGVKRAAWNHKQREWRNVPLAVYVYGGQWRRALPLIEISEFFWKICKFQRASRAVEETFGARHEVGVVEELRVDNFCRRGWDCLLFRLRPGHPGKDGQRAIKGSCETINHRA